MLQNTNITYGIIIIIRNLYFVVNNTGCPKKN